MRSIIVSYACRVLFSFDSCATPPRHVPEGNLVNCVFYLACNRGHTRFVCADRSRVPELGFGGVLDGVRHLLRFALDLMTVGLIDDEVSSEYIQELEWYNALPGILGAYDDAN